MGWKDMRWDHGGRCCWAHSARQEHHMSWRRSSGLDLHGAWQREAVVPMSEGCSALMARPEAGMHACWEPPLMLWNHSKTPLSCCTEIGHVHGTLVQAFCPELAIEQCSRAV